MKVRKNFCLIVLLSILFLLFIPNAIFASDTYTVTFDSNGGSAVDSILVDEGALITEPSAPTREGFTFAGWYKDQSFADDWDFEEDKTTSNTILYARWYKEGYNEYEYFRIQEILNFPSATAGKSNGQVLNTNYNSEDPQTWSVVWENTDSNRHILYINWMHPILYGDMDLSNFTALKEFTLFWENKVNSLNLSNDTALTRVSCETGTITSINLSNDIALVDFSCHHNKITSLDLSSNTILKYLDCSENQLTLLNVDNNPNLEEINCEKNNIGSLNLSNNNKLTELLCDDNKILSLDLSNNQDLFRLQCKDLTNITLNLYNSPVSITVMGKGSLSVDNDDDGWTWTVHANPSPACIFYNWTKNNVQISNLNEIEITSALNGEIYANFSDEIYYNVYFDTGESTTQTTVAINSLIQKPQNPQRTGYTFSTWSTAQFGGMIWDFNTNIVTCDMTLYAKWVINSYPVKFESNNGSHVNDIYAVYNTTIAEPEVPFRGGYNFDGWYKDSQLTQKWDFSTDKVTSMITLYAKWVLATYCTVSFECNGGSAKNSVSTKQYSIMSTPIPPTKTGYYFAGWFKDPELTQLWNFSTDIVTADMTLYANWSTERYTVNFECNGGSAVNDILASPNSTITSPDEPTKIGTYFVGWYKDPSLTQVWNFRTDIVTDSITLYAKWSIINYMVNFNSNGGSTVNYISTTYNTIITAPPPPTKAYYTFAGWYKESECTNLWNFDTDTVTHTITLYAKWVTADYIVSFNTNGGSTVESISTTYNSIISKPADPTYWGYVFGGWYKEPEFVNKWNFASDKVTVSITLYAKWIPINVNELQALRDFLNQPSAVAGKTNGQVLSSNYDQYYTNTWSSCFNWSIIDDEYYLTSISIANKQVSGTLNISGFSKLTSINCTSTGINSINVANNPLLYSVSCLYDDNLTALIVKDNPVLKKIQCQSGQISSLNAENNSCLDELNCSSNKLTSLNISNCNLLTILKCNYNMLTSLNVSENTELITLDCSNNKITSLNVSKMSSLAKLDCYNNQISNLDVSKNTLLTSLDCSGNLLTKLNIGVQENILTKLNYSDNKISTLNVSNCINLESLGCANNNLTSVNVSNNLKLKSLDCGYNPLTSLNLGNNTLLEGLRVSKTNLSKLDLSKLTALKVLYCEINNYLTSLDLSHNTNLTHLYCEFSELTSLDLSNNKLLKLVYCEHNHIRSLDFSNNPELTDLWCGSNELESLNVTKNSKLWYLHCCLNNLTSLDLSNNHDLYTLICDRNQLTSLNLDNAYYLQGLTCDNNKLTSLDVSDSTILKGINCNNNLLTSIDISKNIVLQRFNCDNNKLNNIKFLYKDQISNVCARGSGYVTINFDLYNHPSYIDIAAIPCTGTSFINWTVSDSVFSTNPISKITNPLNNILTANFNIVSPKITSAKSTSYNSITIAWSPVSGAMDYDIYRATSSSGTYSKIGTVSSTSYTDTSLITGKYYYYKIQAAYNSGSQKINSNYSAVKYAKPIPATPVITSIASTGYDRIKLGWNAVDGATGYRVYRSTSSSGTYTYLGATTSTSYTSTGLATGKYYYYKVLAYTTANGVSTYSGYSAVKYAKVIPAMPTASASSYNYNSIRVGWSAVSGASGYELYKTSSETGNYTLLKSTTSTYFVNTSLTTGSTYYYKVRAYRLVGRTKVYGAFSFVTSAMPVPSAPAPAAVSSGYTSNKISWAAVSGASGYELYKTDINGEIQSQLDIAPETAISYTHEGLTTNTPYYYKVKAYRTINGNKVYGPYSKIVTAIPVPSAPIVKVTLNSYNSLNITWNAIDGADKYEISRSTSSASGYAPIYTTDTLSYTDAGLATGKTYYYKVRALINGNPLVYGDYSKVTSLKVIPTTPVIKVSVYTYTSLKISWNEVEGATGYRVYRATSSSGTYTYLGATTSTSYTSTGLATGKYYYYKVLAYTTANGVTTYSSYSSVKYAKVTPSTPTASAESYSSNSIKISWGAVSGATMYELYWAASESGNYTFLKSTTAAYFIHKQLSEGSVYYYKVRAYHLEGSTKVYSSYSQVVYATPAP